MGAALVTISLIYWVVKKIAKWYLGLQNTAEPFQLQVSNTVGALFGGAIALAISLSVALFALLLSSTNSYYEQVMAENATYIAFYMLVILGIYFPLSSFKGPEFATTWMTLYYILTWIQSISTVTIVFDAIGRYGAITFGDEPCLRARLGNSSIANPVVYSTLFLLVGLLSRLLLLLSFTFKAIGMWFQLLRSGENDPKAALNPPPSRGKTFNLRLRSAMSDSEALSLLVALPLCIFGFSMVLGWLMVRFLYSLLTKQATTIEESKSSLRQYLESIPEVMDSGFDKASSAAWFLSFLSLPLIWLDVAFVVRVRDAMSIVAGSSWIENQMGFGQILALFIWMPVIVGYMMSLGRSKTIFSRTSEGYANSSSKSSKL